VGLNHWRKKDQSIHKNAKKNSRVSLTTRRTTEEKRHLTVSDGLLGQIVIDDQRVHAVVTEVLSHSGTRVRGQELEGSGIGSSGSNNDGVLEGIVLFKGLHKLSDSGSLLSNSNVDTVEFFGCLAMHMALAGVFFWKKLTSEV
jgi:hypothetical protein